MVAPRNPTQGRRHRTHAEPEFIATILPLRTKYCSFGQFGHTQNLDCAEFTPFSAKFENFLGHFDGFRIAAPRGPSNCECRLYFTDLRKLPKLSAG